MPERPGFSPDAERPTQFVFAGIGSAKKEHARDAALARLSEKPAGEMPKGWKKLFSGAFWKTVGRQIWKQNLARDYYEVKYQKEAEKKIEQHGSLYVNEKELDPNEKGISETEKNRRLALAKQAHDEAMKSLVGRFSKQEGEFVEDYLHSGEKRETLGGSEEEKRIKEEIVGLVKAYARGAVDEAGFYEHKNRIFARIQGAKPEVIDKGEMYADNLFEIAKWAKAEVECQVAQNIDHNTAIQNLDLDFDVVVAKAKTGVKTEAQFNSVEKIVDSFQKHTRGVINETTVTAAVAITYGVGKRIITSSVAKAAGLFGLGVAGTGAIAATREGVRMEKERMQHAREMAQGRKFEESTSARRKELEESRINFRTAKELEADINRSLFDRLQGGREAKDLSTEEYQEALKAVAELEARVKESDRGIFVRQKKWWQVWRSNKRHKADLIGYSDVTKVTQEQDGLDRLRATAKTKLLQWAAAHGQTKEQFMAIMSNAVENDIRGFYEGDEGITKKNELFVKLKHKRMWQAGRKAAMWSGIIGLSVQEALAFKDSDTYGALEHLKDTATGHHHDYVPHYDNEGHLIPEKTTLLNRPFYSSVEQPGLAAAHAAAGTNSYEMYSGRRYDLDNDMRFVPASPNNPNDFYLADSQGHHISGQLHMDANGNLSPDSQKWLAEHGFGVDENVERHMEGVAGLDAAKTHEMFPDLARHPRIDWHDEPGSYWSEIHKKWLEFEGKQQMGHLVKQGDDVYLDCRAVIHNFRQELIERVNSPEFGRVEGYYNPDGTPFIDPGMAHLRMQIIEAVNSGELEKHFQAVIIPTEGANQEGLSDLLQDADSRGMIDLGRWSSYFTNPEHLRDGHLPIKYIEMRFDGHVMNTIKGESVISEVPVTHIVPPVFDPPEVTPPIVVPPVFYAGRRKGLEDTSRVPEEVSPPPVRYGYYSGEHKKDMPTGQRADIYRNSEQ